MKAKPEATNSRWRDEPTKNWLATLEFANDTDEVALILYCHYPESLIPSEVIRDMREPTTRLFLNLVYCS